MLIPDRENVIKAWEDVLSRDPLDAPWDLIDDTLALLKEQEPVPSGKRIKAGDVVLCFYECGHCKNAIRKPWRYCPFCGRKVKWDDA